MHAAPEQVPAERLRRLLARYDAEAALLQTELWNQQAALERAEQAAARSAGTAEADLDRLADRCAMLQTRVDELAVELAHVRLAAEGAAEELQLHRRGAGSAA